MPAAPTSCDKAQAARAALETMLGEGGVTISRVGVDKYGGRVDATVATRGTADVSAAMLNGGFARAMTAAVAARGAVADQTTEDRRRLIPSI